MKRALLAPLLLAAAGALAAAPADEIYDTCVVQMQAGTCRVLRDQSAYTPEQLATPIRIAGIGVVPFSAYLAVRGTGDIRMCAVARDACSADWNSDRCKIGRAFWSK